MSPRPLPVARFLLSRLGIAALAVAGLAGCAENSPHPLPEGAFLVQDRALSEMSGLEASVRDPGVLWSVNDSGSRPRLFRLGRRGEDLGVAQKLERDRRAAIALALADTGAGDIVLVAGKGHEPYQEIDGVQHPFDDTQVARACLEARA